mgnify:CR=1 FL=1
MFPTTSSDFEVWEGQTLQQKVLAFDTHVDWYFNKLSQRPKISYCTTCTNVYNNQTTLYYDKQHMSNDYLEKSKS